MCNGWFPEDGIVKEHNHVIALEFEKAIPEIFYKLYIENEYRRMAPSGSFRLGLRFKDDFPIIAKNTKANLHDKLDSEKS